MTPPRLPNLTLSLLALSLLHFKPPPRNPTLGRFDEHHAATPTNYIVRFRDYKRVENHRSYLERRVKSRGWKWIDRLNDAVTRFPTDFELVAVEDAARVSVVEELEGLDLVKDVHPDRSYQRSLLREEERMGKVGAFVDGKKRLGKIFKGKALWYCAVLAHGQPKVAERDRLFATLLSQVQ